MVGSGRLGKRAGGKLIGGIELGENSASGSNCEDGLLELGHPRVQAFLIGLTALPSGSHLRLRSCIVQAEPNGPPAAGAGHRKRR